MESKNFRNLIIGMLCAVVLFMSVGFAFLATTLRINGSVNVTNASWDVKITDITPNATPTTVNQAATVATGGLSATFEALFTAPGDTVSYTVTITNNGTLPAVIEDVRGPANLGTGYDMITVNEAAYKAAAIGQEIAPNGGELTMVITFTYDATITDTANLAPNTVTPIDYTIEIDCVQKH